MANNGDVMLHVMAAEFKSIPRCFPNFGEVRTVDINTNDSCHGLRFKTLSFVAANTKRNFIRGNILDPLAPVSTVVENIFVMSWENLSYAICEQHPRSLISAFIVRCLNSIRLVFVKSTNFKLVSVGGQVGLKLTWSQTSKTDLLVTWSNR